MSKEAMKLALEALEEINRLSIGENAICLPAEIDTAMDAIREALAEQQSGIKQVIELYDSPEQPAQQQYQSTADKCELTPVPAKGTLLPTQQQPVAWRNAALRVGEDLCSVGPFGYYDMTAEQWLDWALSVVTVHAPPASKPWVGLTDEEIVQTLGNIRERLDGNVFYAFARAIEAKLREKNA